MWGQSVNETGMAHAEWRTQACGLKSPVDRHYSVDADQKIRILDEGRRQVCGEGFCRGGRRRRSEKLNAPVPTQQRLALTIRTAQIVNKHLLIASEHR